MTEQKRDRKSLTGVVTPQPTTGTERQRTQTGNNPIAPRRVPVNSKPGTKAANPIAPMRKPKPPASQK
jgi:hypothetical protein